jgi:phage tail sheath protein FI
MLLYLEKVISTSVRYLVFEPNDPLTWDTFIAMVSPYVDEVRRGRGLADVKVICDKSINDANAQDRSEMYGKILLKPTPTAEFINVDFNLYSSGATFSA